MNNLLLWINSVGLIEAGRLAQTTGIDLVKLRDALQMSSGASAALNDWDMITFTWALKDMQVVAEMTDKAGLALPITGAIKELGSAPHQGGEPAELDRDEGGGASFVGTPIARRRRA
jgi:3-hydroxyisobutyrate dehydrogenase-like beta-hydroxyacid dehydrogenase